MSTTEELLQALIDGKATDIAPRSRIEAYLKNCVDRCGCEGLPAPKSRIDALLYELAEVMAGGGTGGGNTGGNTGSGGSGETEEIDVKQALKIYFDYTKDASYFFSKQREAFDPSRGNGNAITDDEIDSLLTYASAEKVEYASGMFLGCKNITRIPNLNISKIHTAPNMFEGCVKLDGADITFGAGRATNVLAISDLFCNCVGLTSATVRADSNAEVNCSGMFRGCTKLKTYSLPSVRVYGVSSMFSGCTSLVGGEPLDTRGANYFDNMFYNCISLVEAPVLDYTMSLAANTVFSTSNMFYNCKALKKAPNIESPGAGYSGVKGWNTEKMFYGCSSLEDISGVVATLIPLSTTMDSMFFKCIALKTLPNLNLQNCTRLFEAFRESGLVNVGDINALAIKSAQNMFYSCKSLTNVGNISMPTATNLNSAFYQCSSLKRVESIYAPNATDLAKLFNNDSGLEYVGDVSSQAAQDVSQAFYGCSALTTIKSFDMRNATTTSAFISACPALTNLTLLNIKANLQVAYSTTWGHLLTVDSLVKLIYECRDTGSIKTLTIANVNREKLANVYVKTIDITDEMRAEDDLIDEKLPFVVCESTDEGAMLITNYVTLKNWKLA